jgi:hypothetical protein
MKIIFFKEIAKAFEINILRNEDKREDVELVKRFKLYLNNSPLKKNQEVNVFYNTFSINLNNPFLIVNKDINQYHIEKKLFLDCGLYF